MWSNRSSKADRYRKRAVWITVLAGPLTVTVTQALFARFPAAPSWASVVVGAIVIGAAWVIVSYLARAEYRARYQGARGQHAGTSWQADWPT